MENKDLNRVERILNSLDKMQKATAPDFFYTRLSGRMQNELEVKGKPFFIPRPAFITASLLVVLAGNIISLIRLNGSPAQKSTVQSSKPATIDSFAEAYNIVTVSVYE